MTYKLFKTTLFKDVLSHFFDITKVTFIGSSLKLFYYSVFHLRKI